MRDHKQPEPHRERKTQGPKAAAEEKRYYRLYDVAEFKRY